MNIYIDMFACVSHGYIDKKMKRNRPSSSTFRLMWSKHQGGELIGTSDVMILTWNLVPYETMISQYIKTHDVG